MATLTPAAPAVGLDTTVNVTTFPTRTYYVDRDLGRIISMVDELDAMDQAIDKILWTERYYWLIYSWNYGIELESLVGQNPSYVTSEIKRRITEALLADDRIESVTDFTFYKSDIDDMTVTFKVNTIYGTVTKTRGVTM